MNYKAFVILAFVGRPVVDIIDCVTRGPRPGHMCTLDCVTRGPRSGHRYGTGCVTRGPRSGHRFFYGKL